MTDSSGNGRARYDYDPYGRRMKLSGDRDADIGFTGHYFHVQTGMTLAPYRIYDADLGRWLSRDPLGELGGQNLYAYLRGRPVNGFDPLGLSGFWGELAQNFNPLNPNGSFYKTANSIGEALGGMLAGNWDQVANAYADSVLGQTECNQLAESSERFVSSFHSCCHYCLWWYPI